MYTLVHPRIGCMIDRGTWNNLRSTWHTTSETIQKIHESCTTQERLEFSHIQTPTRFVLQGLKQNWDVDGVPQIHGLPSVGIPSSFPSVCRNDKVLLRSKNVLSRGIRKTVTKPVTNDRTMENTFTMRKKRKTYSDTPFWYDYSYTGIPSPCLWWEILAAHPISNRKQGREEDRFAFLNMKLYPKYSWETLHQMFSVEDPGLVVWQRHFNSHFKAIRALSRLIVFSYSST